MKLLTQSVFAAAAVLACGASFAQVSYDANVELNNVFKNTKPSSFTSGGRVEFNLNGKATKGENFVMGRGTVALKHDGTTGVDDMWMQMGNAMMDLKLGRFEGMDLFPTGKDVVVADMSAAGYKASTLRGRVDGKSADMHAALGFNAMPGLRAELGVIVGRGTYDNGAKDANGKPVMQNKTRGVRPAVSYSMDALTVRAGLETVRAADTGKNSVGMGVSVGYKLAANSDVNVNFAKLKSDKSLGVNATMGDAGVGLIHNMGAGSTYSTAVYGAYTLPLLDVKGASITPALSLGKTKDVSSQVAANVRLNYAF